MKYSRTHDLVIFATVILSIFIFPNASAVCRITSDQKQGKSNPTKVIVGYAPKMPRFHDEGDGYNAMAFPIKPPEDLLRINELRELSKEAMDTISYFELDSNKGWRVCRIEHWLPPRFSEGDEKRSQRLARSERFTDNNRIIKGVTRGHIITTAIYVHYDADGRIERVSELDVDSLEQPYRDIGCRRYDDKHRLVMSIQPKVTKQCPKGQPDLRDSWFEFKYGNVGEFGVPERLLWKHHVGSEDGHWYEEWQPFVMGSSYKDPWGHADVSSTKGVTLIWGASVGQRDNNAANTVLDSYGQSVGSNYEFTRPPIPVEVLIDSNALYKYERRRYTIINGVKMYELFPPNGHLSRHRYYLLDGLVMRHEQLNSDGTAKRVITLNNYAQPRPGPDPLINDKSLSRTSMLFHQVFHRVYEIDRAGNPRLVAMSWNRRKRLLPSDNVPVEFADLVYGTPDGKERWKTQGEFEKAFDTSSRAAHVFPDLKHDPIYGMGNKK